MNAKKLLILLFFSFILIIITVSALPDSNTQASGNICNRKHYLNYNYNFEYPNNLEIGKSYDLIISFSLSGNEVNTNPHQLNVGITPVGFTLTESSFSMGSSKTIKITPTSENPSLQVKTTLILDGDNPSHRGYEATFVDNFDINDFVVGGGSLTNHSSSTNTGDKNITQTTTIGENTQTDINVNVVSPSKAPWYLVRLMGILAFLFLSLSVFISLSKKAKYNFFPSIFKYHHDISIFAILFALLHVINNLLDNYRWNFDLTDIFWFNFSSTSRIMVSLGVISLYLMLIVVITSLSPKIISFLKYNNWKRIHILSYAIYILVIIHSFFIGTDLNLSNLSNPLTLIAIILFSLLTLANVISFLIFLFKYFKRDKIQTPLVSGEEQ